MLRQLTDQIGGVRQYYIVFFWGKPMMTDDSKFKPNKEGEAVCRLYSSFQLNPPPPPVMSATSALFQCRPRKISRNGPVTPGLQSTRSKSTQGSGFKLTRGNTDLQSPLDSLWFGSERRATLQGYYSQRRQGG